MESGRNELAAPLDIRLNHVSQDRARHVAECPRTGISREETQALELYIRAKRLIDATESSLITFLVNQLMRSIESMINRISEECN